MARRSRRSRGSYRARRSFSRGSRRATGRKFRGRAGRARSSQTVRIVLEQPAHNPVSRPGIPGLVGLAQDNTQPRKKMF